MGFRKLGALKLIDVYISLNISWVIRLRIMTRAGI